MTGRGTWRTIGSARNIWLTFRLARARCPPRSTGSRNYTEGRLLSADTIERDAKKAASDATP